MAQDRWGGFETDAGPSPQTLATLVGVSANQPNNFMPVPSPGHLEFSDSQVESSTSVVNNNVVNNSPRSVIQIENGSNFHIGNSFAFNFSSSKNKKIKKKPTNTQKDFSSELPAILLRSDLRVTTANIKGVRIGEPWRFVMRHLHLTDAEIENKHEEYINKGGIEEVIYQLLRMWSEKNGTDATLDKLSKALGKENQYEALQKLQANYSQE